MPVDVTPTNMIATCGGMGSDKVPAGIVGVSGVMRFFVLEEPMSICRRKTTVHSAFDTNHAPAPVGSNHSNEGKR